MEYVIPNVSTVLVIVRDELYKIYQETIGICTFQCVSRFEISQYAWKKASISDTDRNIWSRLCKSRKSPYRIKSMNWGECSFRYSERCWLIKFITICMKFNISLDMRDQWSAKFTVFLPQPFFLMTKSKDILKLKRNPWIIFRLVDNRALHFWNYIFFSGV